MNRIVCELEGIFPFLKAAAQKVDTMVDEMQKVLGKAQQFQSVSVKLTKSVEAQVSQLVDSIIVMFWYFLSCDVLVSPFCPFTTFWILLSPESKQTVLIV